MIITLTGSNSLALKNELQKLVDSFVKKHSDLALERLDGEEASLERVLEAIQSLPLLANRKMVVLRNGAKNKAIAEHIEQIIDSKNEHSDLLLVEPELDKRTSYYKTLKSRTDFKFFDEFDEIQLGRWLVSEAKRAGGSLSSADANYLIQRVGTNQLLLQNELAKLLTFQPDITRTSIDLLTEPEPQSTIFELLDAAFRGDTNRTISLYAEQRQLKVEPQQIMAMIGWQLHALAVVKTAGERSVADIAREAKLNPFVVRKSQGIAKRISFESLKGLIHQALELDIRLKSQTIDTDEALQHFLLTLSQQEVTS